MKRSSTATSVDLPDPLGPTTPSRRPRREGRRPAARTPPTRPSPRSLLPGRARDARRASFFGRRRGRRPRVSAATRASILASALSARTMSAPASVTGTRTSTSASGTSTSSAATGARSDPVVTRSRDPQGDHEGRGAGRRRAPRSGPAPTPPPTGPRRRPSARRPTGPRRGRSGSARQAAISPAPWSSRVDLRRDVGAGLDAAMLVPRGAEPGDREPDEARARAGSPPGRGPRQARAARPAAQDDQRDDHPGEQRGADPQLAVDERVDVVDDRGQDVAALAAEPARHEGHQRVVHAGASLGEQSQRDVVADEPLGVAEDRAGPGRRRARRRSRPSGRAPGAARRPG